MDTIVAILGIVIFLAYVAYLINKHRNDWVCHKQFSNDTVINDIDSGISLLPSNKRYVTIDEIVQVYYDTQRCTELKAPGPIVEFVSFDQKGLPATWGEYIPVARRVMVNTDRIRDCQRDKQILRHEFVHHLMNKNGLELESSQHNSPLFNKCGQGISTVDGV